MRPVLVLILPAERSGSGVHPEKHLQIAVFVSSNRG
jgi:hypothetical protein